MNNGHRQKIWHTERTKQRPVWLNHPLKERRDLEETREFGKGQNTAWKLR
jgi:hypothetical protein